MASKVWGYVRRNHLGLIAIFIALGGTTYAATEVGSDDIERNAVRSKHIKAKQVKPGDLSPRARSSCPAGTRAFDDLCVRPATTEDTHQASLDVCIGHGLRLPTYSEAELLVEQHDVPGVTGSEFFWTDEYGDSNFPVIVNEPGDAAFSSPAAVHRTLCVAQPRPGG